MFEGRKPPPSSVVSASFISVTLSESRMHAADSLCYLTSASLSPSAPERVTEIWWGKRMRGLRRGAEAQGTTRERKGGSKKEEKNRMKTENFFRKCTNTWWPEKWGGTCSSHHFAHKLLLKNMHAVSIPNVLNLNIVQNNRYVIKSVKCRTSQTTPTSFKTRNKRVQVGFLFYVNQKHQTWLLDEVMIKKNNSWSECACCLKCRCGEVSPGWSWKTRRNHLSPRVWALLTTLRKSR